MIDYVEDWVASGNTLLDLAESISESVNTDISREMISRICNRLTPDADARLEAARRRGAHGLAEEAKQIVDDVALDREAIAAAKLQADSRFWLAERWNRSEMGIKQGADVTLNLNVLHLDAVRARSQATATIVNTHEPKQLQAVEAEVIVIDEDNTGG